MRQEILERLMPHTEEEIAILGGRTEIDSSIYSEGEGGVVLAEKLLPRDKQISIRPHTRFIRFPEHTHDYTEAVYMCSGTTTHIIDGREIVLKEGELLLLSRGARQEILPAGEGDIAVNFIIKDTFFDKTLEMLGAEDTPIKNFLVGSLLDPEMRGCLHFKVAGVVPIQNLIENLIWTLIHNMPNKRNINQTTMGLLFMQLLNHTDRLAYVTREEAAVLGVLRYIEENYKNGSLSEAAELLHYDFFWLSHEIKERTGKPYTEHLQEKRLSQAAYLLVHTDMSVEAVAGAVGYENKSYFHRIFAQRFGLTPRKYRIAEDRE